MNRELVIREATRSYAGRDSIAPALHHGTLPAKHRMATAHAGLVGALCGRAHQLQRCGMACMPCTRLGFSPQRLPPSKLDELDRQLAGQQEGLNALTVAQYLCARQRFDPAERDPQVARRARVSWRDKLMQARTGALRERGGGDEAAMASLARVQVEQQMRSLHALHNPDRVAGGHDVIADFGDGQVNSTIGRQWNLKRRGEPSRVQQLDRAAAGVPFAYREVTRMNGLLVRDS